MCDNYDNDDDYVDEIVVCGHGVEWLSFTLCTYISPMIYLFIRFLFIQLRNGCVNIKYYYIHTCIFIFCKP